MKEPIRILHITGGLNMGGIENFLMNIYRKIDTNKIQFDFLIHSKEEQFFEKEIKEKGGKIYKIPSIREVGYLKYKTELKNFFIDHKEYNILHSHYNEVTGVIFDSCDKSRYRIAHSHAAYPKYSNFLVKIFAEYLKHLLRKNTNFRFACSKEAGKWLYGGDTFKILNNGINVSKFLFNEKLRTEIRKVLNLNKEEIALVNVSRLTYQKNHKFLIKIMEKLNNLDKRFKLFLIGDGELELELKKDIEKKKIENIVFLGVKDNINEVLNAMDLFVFPSLSEGLGIVAIEAQSNGLQVLASKNVPKEADMDVGLFKKLDIIDTDIWIEEILKLTNKVKRSQEEIEIKKILQSSFNIDKVAKELEKFYLELE